MSAGDNVNIWLLTDLQIDKRKWKDLMVLKVVAFWEGKNERKRLRYGGNWLSEPRIHFRRFFNNEFLISHGSLDQTTSRTVSKYPARYSALRAAELILCFNALSSSTT